MSTSPKNVVVNYFFEVIFEIRNIMLLYTIIEESKEASGVRNI